MTQTYPPIKTPRINIKSPMRKPSASEKITLIDALDKVLEKGAVISGDVAIRVADVDLIYLGLRVLLTSVSKAEELSGRNFSDSKREPTAEELEYMANLEREIRKAEANIPRLIDANSPQKAEQGIAKLVLILVELLRRLMEKEAIRRIQRQTLSNTEIQKLGMTFKALEKKIQELKIVFGLEDEELNLNLGPLGNLM